MDIIEIERSLTVWAAEVLGLEVDAGIYRGGIPAAPETGVSVKLGSSLNDNSWDHRRYNVQILGKFADRDEAQRMLARIDTALPVYGITVNGVRFSQMAVRGGGEPYSVTDRGRFKWMASSNLIVSVLTTDAQV